MATDVNNPGIVNQEPKQAPDVKKEDREINFERLRKKTEALESELQKRDALLQQQQDALNQLQARFQPVDRDELDTLPDEELIDKAKFKRLIEKERQNLRKEAEEVARQTYQKLDNENFAYKLKTSYPDYDQVVNSANAEVLQDKDPDFVALLGEVKDEFKRREMAYKRIKKVIQEQQPPKVKAQEIVEENRQKAGAYYSPQGQGPMSNPYGFEFDVRSKEAKSQAYAKLKAAQKRTS